METTQQSEHLNSEKKELPCIFGSKFHAKCPIRAEITQDSQKDPFRRYVQQPEMVKNLIPVFDEMKGLMNSLTAIHLTTLAKFCQCCPYIRGQKRT